MTAFSVRSRTRATVFTKLMQHTTNKQTRIQFETVVLATNQSKTYPNPHRIGATIRAAIAALPTGSLQIRLNAALIVAPLVNASAIPK